MLGISSLILPIFDVYCLSGNSPAARLIEGTVNACKFPAKTGCRASGRRRDHSTCQGYNGLGDMARNWVHGIVFATAIAVPLPPPSFAQAKPGLAPNTLADGTWTVQGRELPGARCGHWLVRLTNAHGDLSGVVSLARGSVSLTNLTLMPDGSFSGSTRAGIVGSTYARAYKVTGRFSGDTVHLTLKNDICPARHGVARRSQTHGR
jgi:hypothetical protein